MSHPTTTVASSICAGDRWHQGGDVVAIDAIEIKHGPDPAFPEGRVRLSGRIVRGYGKSKRTLTWSFPATAELQIERGRS